MGIFGQLPFTVVMADDSKNSTLTGKKLSKEDVERLGDRLYTQSMDQKRKKLEALESKYYKTEEPKTISKAEAEESALRQVNQEMEMRRKRQAELERKVHKEEEPRTLTQEEIDESVRRMYNEPMDIKKKKLEVLQKRYAPEPEKGKRLGKSQQAEMASRLCQPKKQIYTDEEINKVYGF